MTEEHAKSKPQFSGPDRILDFADYLLAGEEEEARPEEHYETWVVFRIAGGSYGLPVTHVRQVSRCGEMTRVPGAPFPVLGVTALRGQALPVIDLGERLGVGPVEVRDATRILVAEVRRRKLGLLVDRVDQVMQFAQSRVQSVSASDVGSEAAELLIGAYPLPEDSILMLDVEKLLLGGQSAEKGETG